MMNYTAMTLGNHEFDDGDDQLAEYLANLTFPVLVSNIRAEKSQINGLFRPYTIVEVSATKIAIIGNQKD